MIWVEGVCGLGCFWSVDRMIEEFTNGNENENESMN